MSKWLLSIVGVIFLGVMMDLLYPAGKTNKLCKGIFGAIAVFVIISPILSWDIDSAFSNFSTNISLDKGLIDARDDSYIRLITSKLNESGLSNVVVEIDSKIDNNDYTINNVYVDITNLVLTDKLANINKYEVIASCVTEVTGVNKERVVVYGQ
ncbi:MAG: hypothetical protein E7356_00355 [Clostridiales bacterium]|nr:hypothetical protein [Clostridiales bacterium]